MRFTSIFSPSPQKESFIQEYMPPSTGAGGLRSSMLTVSLPRSLMSTVSDDMERGGFFRTFRHWLGKAD